MGLCKSHTTYIYMDGHTQNVEGYTQNVEGYTQNVEGIRLLHSLCRDAKNLKWCLIQMYPNQISQISRSHLAFDFKVLNGSQTTSAHTNHFRSHLSM